MATNNNSVSSDDAMKIVFTEQVLASLMKAANAKIAQAIETKESMFPGSESYKALETNITNFRENVVQTIQSKISALEAEKLSIGGVSKDDWILI